MSKLLKPVALGIVGVLLAFVGLHLYVDHQSLHVLIGIENARQAQLREGK